MEINLKEKLSNIQNEMNVPKNLFNKFGNYYYRNAETILEVAKAICQKYRTVLTVSDEIIQVGDRFYIKAVAKLADFDSDNTIYNEAYAREALEKKGMDSSQVTGAASSYARKYALNGLFNLDDVKDADDPATNNDKPEPKKVDLISKNQIEYLVNAYGDKLHKLLETNKLSKIEDMPCGLAIEYCTKIEEIAKKKARKTVDENNQ